MIRFVLICWLIAFCWVQSAESTNAFIKNLLTTTPSSSHISDFRKQKRTDSRADKPDTFPGFDLHEDSTTPSPRKRRRQAYSKLIRLFLQNTKDRLDTIRDVIKDESELHFRLTRPPGEASGENLAGNPTEHNAEIRFSDDENRQFIDFAFADATNSDKTSENIGKMENKGRDNAAQTYLNSLFAAVGYQRITTTPNPIESDETTSGNIFARYLINPLVSVWNSTQQRFNWNEAWQSGENDNSDEDNVDIVESISSSDGQTMLFRINFFDNRDDITPNMHTNSNASDTNKEPNENRVDNFNYSLPLIQLTPNNVTDDMLTNETVTLQVNANKANVSQSMLDVDYIGDDHIDNDKKKPRNTVTSRAHNVEDAAEAFRNAFLKYSNYMQHSTEYAKFDTSTNENAKTTRNNSHAPKGDKLLLDGSRGDGSGFLTGNLFETNSSHIQVVPSKKLKSNASISENVTIANDVDDSIELPPTKSFAENAGILILEIFGTVIGMTYRAVSGIPSYFNAHQNNQNEDA